MEFSGLKPTYETLIDNPSERFKKLKFIGEKYRIIQLGLVPFKKLSENKFQAKPYNIYVFPNEEQNNNKFDMEIGAIIFNKNNGIDFNKWIYHGVSYLNDENLKRLCDRLMNGNINKYNPNTKNSYKHINLYKENDKKIFQEFFNKFNQFYQNSNEKELKIEKIQKHILIYFLNTISDSIRNTIFISYLDEKKEKDKVKSYIIFTKVSFEQKENMVNEENNAIIKHILKAKGVKNLIEKIIEKKKILIGHNCVIDIMFILTHFMEEIPLGYELFKKRLSNEFGGIYDTKYLFYNYKKENEISFHLEKLFKDFYNLYKDKIEIIIPQNFTNYLKDNNENQNNFHHADYDAFVTGCSYIYMINEYGLNYINNNINKLNFVSCIYKGMNLNGKDELKNNANLCYVVSSIQEKNNVNYNFVYNFNCEEIKKIYNYDKFNCVVVLIEKKGNESEFLKLMEKYKDSFKVSLLEDFKKEKEKEKEDNAKLSEKMNNLKF